MELKKIEFGKLKKGEIFCPNDLKKDEFGNYYADTAKKIDNNHYVMIHGGSFLIKCKTSKIVYI